MDAASLMRSIGRGAMRAALAALVITTSACPIFLPTPGANERGVDKQSVERFQARRTTRTDVLMTLGDPDYRLEDDRYFVYDWSETHAFVGVGLPGGAIAGTGLGEQHALAIEFAPDNRVARLREFTHDSGNKERAEKALWQDIRKWMKGSASAKP
jgi:outer membrane protein assembly factor BamE (lipoprotein component of BamABCDE complex)